MNPVPVLPPACPGEMRLLDTAAGPVALYAAGPADGVPLLLVHSVNAAASAFEVRPIYEHFAGSRPVYALDLPGYGHSDRSDRPYTIRLMTDAVLAAQAAVAARHGGAPVHALAVSLGCEFLARAAVERPAAFASLALVSPTAFNGAKPRRGAAGSNLGVAGLYRVLSSSLLSDAVFNNLTRPGVIRFFLKKTWGSKAIDEPMWRYDCLTTRMPGARHAPLRFVSAFLFSGDAFALYEALTLPVWMSHGVRGDFTDYRLKRLVEGKPDWRITEYPTGAMPYFEIGPRFMADYAAFLADGKVRQA
jgi:pimeloyl-ACP methyl ester carboxylesterase